MKEYKFYLFNLTHSGWVQGVTPKEIENGVVKTWTIIYCSSKKEAHEFTFKEMETFVDYYNTPNCDIRAVPIDSRKYSAPYGCPAAWRVVRNWRQATFRIGWVKSELGKTQGDIVINGEDKYLFSFTT